MIPWLSVLVCLPLSAGVGLLLRPQFKPVAIAQLASLATLLVGFWVAYQFDSSLGDMQFVEVHPWIASLGAQYALGVDGIALPLVLLGCAMTLLVCVMAPVSVSKHLGEYLGAFLLMLGLMNGVFLATDALLFYVFWEATLVPMFLIMGVWGGDRRVYAAMKFFLYTFLGSVLMLVALLYLATQSDGFNLFSWYGLSLPFRVQQAVFLAFFVAFAVKIPMWPVHTWLPDAHVEAPTGGSVILAAMMLKLGGYGFIRFAMPLAPQAAMYFAPWVLILSLIAVVYIGLVALNQYDMKKLIAYSSIAHMGFVTLGLFAVVSLLDTGGALLAVSGAMVQMISHGFISAGLFLCVGVLYDRLHSRLIRDYGGVANRMPIFASLFMLFSMANAGLPGTSGFVGEFMVILAVLKVGFWFAFAAAITLLLAPAYTLWMYKRVVFGEVIHTTVASMRDLNRREAFVLGVLAIMVLTLGIYPQPLMSMMDASLQQWLLLLIAR